MDKENFPYGDIIGLPRPRSGRHPRMPAAARAAQFAPFDALSGYGALVRETARFTEPRPEPDEAEQSRINRALRAIMEAQGAQPRADFTYFVPDARKAGGSCRTVSGAVRRVDLCAGAVILADGTEIPVPDILRVRTPLCPED